MREIKLLFIMMMVIISHFTKANKPVFSTQSSFAAMVLSENPSRIITVGDNTADVHGFTSQAIQTAVNKLHDKGGGIVKMLPGIYDVIAPIILFSNISLVGSGNKTILKKSNGIRTQLAVDAGYGELQLKVKDASKFTPGMGIQVFDSLNNSSWNISTAIITAIKDNDIMIDNRLVRDYVADNGGILSNACSIISAVDAENVTIADLFVDGNRENNDAIGGCRAGGIYLHKVKRAVIENVTVKNFNADGISWQITEKVVVRNCEVFGCAGAGLHPGTGSPNTLIEGNYSHDNDLYGLFVCWRVRHGIVRNNRFVHNGHIGISTGHMDTDMLFENNQIAENGIDGVSFRYETQANAPHRNVFKNNIVENNGQKESGYGFSFNSPAEDVILENNIIRNTKGCSQKAAVFIGKNGIPVILKNNIITNHSEGEIVTENKPK